MFILFHLLAVVSWVFPFQLLLKDRIKFQVAPYMMNLGLFQTWGMFAPDPATANSYLDAEITYQDGRMERWDFGPHDGDTPSTDDYRVSRWYKWANEHIMLDAHAALWPDAARFIARIHYKSSKNPPIKIALRRHWLPIPFNDGVTDSSLLYKPADRDTYGSFTFYNFTPNALDFL